jgi:glycosyltransferase involved in cell wall biosynthesis
MKRILLYSPDVVGHPRVYCRIIADALDEVECELILAMGFSDRAGLADSPDLHPILGRRNVCMMDTREISLSGDTRLTAEELRELQEKMGVDVTVFIEADKFESELVRIASGAARPLSGRNVGIFSNTAEWYPGEDSFSGERRTLLANTLRTTLGNIKRAVWNRRDTRRFFFERVLIGNGVLDEYWVKDERLAEWRGRPVFWMPELARPGRHDETAEEDSDLQTRQAELRTFLQSNGTRAPLLYFGDAAYYKGYDLFLEFLRRNPDTCGIHAGRPCDAPERALLHAGIEALRIDLAAQGRLLETNRYVHTQALKELYFTSVPVYATTHRLMLSSSTVIQALELGIPVLVPDRGLLGYRVRTHGLGDVYRYGDLDDMARKLETLWASDLSRFHAAGRRFWRRFSDEAVRTFLTGRLLAA